MPDTGVIDQNLLDLKTDNKAVDEIEILNLHTLSIWKIDNLWMYENLQILRLNGNNIEKLENLDKLINLKELNVSHNKITRIEGLDNLNKLEILLIQHNLLSCLENLENLNNLTLLSVGHNHLTNRDDVIYLRRIKTLRALSLVGNPLCSLNDHLDFIGIILPELRYLDYKIVKKPIQISIELRALLIRVQDVEKAEKEAKETFESKKLRQQLLKDAFVDDLEVEDLVDVFGPKWPAILEIGGEITFAMLKEHREQMKKVCNELQQLGLNRRTDRLKEENEFKNCWDSACKINREKSTSCIDKFLEPKEEIYRTIRRYLRESEKKRNSGGGNDEGNTEIEYAREYADKFNRDTEILSNKLFELEIEIQEQLEDISEKFIERMRESRGILVHETRSLLLHARDLEEQFYLRLQEPIHLKTSNLKLQRNTENNTSKTLSASALQILNDDEILNEWLREIHEERLQRLIKRELKLENDTKIWLDEKIQNISLEAFNRSRFRIMEILNFIEIQRKELSDLQPNSLAFTGLL